METIFQASQFTATEFDTAEHKARMANALLRFIERGCPFTMFTGPLYQAINLHLWSHIAEFNRHGFYGVWFETPYKITMFIERAMRTPSYGDPTHTWSDVGESLTRYFRQHPEIRQRFVDAHNQAVQTAELAELARLKAKYPEVV